MKLRSFIINKVIFWFLIFGLCVSSAFSQKIAVISPEQNQLTEKLTPQLAEKLNSIDIDLSLSVLRSMSFDNIFNLTTEETKNLGNAIGCDFVILLKSENLRRSSLVKSDYFETYAAIYIVSSRTGRLVFWTLKSFEGETAEKADKQLFDSIDSLKDIVLYQTQVAKLSELGESASNQLEELPAEEEKNFKSPLPYKRLRPQYTRIADFYSITVTVEATVDLDEKGQITQIEITRWAGYELDESVKKVINEMQWRPASRNGKTLPIRVLLRYNFKKIEKDE